MSVIRVNATLDKNTVQLSNESLERYRGDVQAPKIHGDYNLSISAYDDAGNVAISDNPIEVTQWHTPKVNWRPTDPVNYTDYNRIKNNLEYLHERACALFKLFEIKDMGEDKAGYQDYTYADEWNLFEENLDTINQNIFTRDYGERQYFFDNNPFIMWDELNRIENAILEMRGSMDRHEAGLPKLAIRLGDYKGVKV